ncbi:hypothetical protein DL96DRAFT_1584840 [Flagelloscypha sp. PMI_526]|nr:hypothetical protein DL96DRAFT_1584840 [Flagelloscypha sp. PMI_526]
MGQRHQAYLIARVVAHGATKATYRCVAAWHHQWSYGRLPPRGVRRFIDLASNRYNAEIILEELKNIEGKYGAVGPLQPRIPDIPLPFSTFLLGCAFNVNLDALDGVYASGYDFLNSTMDAAMTPSQGDNNDGITVIDITDPSNIAYCHASLGYIESPSWPYPSKAPVSGEEYANAYETDFDEGDDTLQILNAARIIPLHVLAEAWPQDFKSDSPAPTVAAVEPTAIPSLVELALSSGVKKAIEDDDLSSLNAFLLDPSKVLAILDILRTQEVYSPPALRLIAQLFPKNLSSVDLSGFRLTTEDLVTVLSSEEFCETETLNLSRNINVRFETITKIASTFPKINRVIVYQTSISVEDIDGLERPVLESLPFLVHPARFELRENARTTSEPGFSFYSSPGIFSNVQNAISIPLQLVNLDLIVHGLSDYLAAVLISAQGRSGGGLGNCQIATMSIFSAAPRKEGQSWGKRTVLFVPTPSQNVLKQGWIFVCSLDSYDPEGYYGFLRPTPPSSAGDKTTYEIHDFDSFLVQMKAEGYGDAPEPLATKVKSQIEAIRIVQLAKMQPSQPDLAGGEGPEVDNTANIMRLLMGSMRVGSAAANSPGLASGSEGFRLIKESELPGNGNRW